MKVGELVSLKNGPERNVFLSVGPEFVESEISIPSNSIESSDITHYIICQREDLWSLHLRLQESDIDVDFYRTRSQFDLTLLLDLFTSEVGDKPRIINKDAEQVGEPNSLPFE